MLSLRVGTSTSITTDAKDRNQALLWCIRWQSV
jgi:hypothetical protein